MELPTFTKCTNIRKRFYLFYFIRLLDYFIRVENKYYYVLQIR